MPALVAELLELAQVARAFDALPTWLSAFGVAWLVIQERRHARRQKKLERTVAVLVNGHSGDPAAHRTIPDNLLEAPAHARE